MRGKRTIDSEFDKESGISGLINAVIMQAAKDYISAARFLKNHPDAKNGPAKARRRYNNASNKLEDARGFFLSEWYKNLCNIDSKKMIEMLDNEVNDESKNISG